MKQIRAHGVPKPATFADGVTKSRMEWAHAELQTRENRKQSNLVSCRLGPSHRGLYVISLHSYRPLPIILPTDCFLPLALPLFSQREHRHACRRSQWMPRAPHQQSPTQAYINTSGPPWGECCHVAANLCATLSRHGRERLVCRAL